MRSYHFTKICPARHISNIWIKYLTVALSLHGKHDEADTIANEILVRFPDYFFGQVMAIRRAIQAKQLEKARNLLDEIMQKMEFHVTESSVLCACQIN